jgi:uncharacterized membrane protein
VSGIFGAVIGADVLNFGAISELGSLVAGIGGVDSFGGVLATGPLAVLLVQGASCRMRRR